MPPRPEAERALVSIDLEMTSARPEAQEIIEIGAVKFVGDRVVGTFSTLVQPPVALPYNIQVLTGIRPAELTRAPKLEAVAPRLLQFIGDSPLVAHTVSSDVGALARKGIVLQNDQIDTHELASILLPQLESYSLASLVRHFGIDQPIQHRALPDAHVTHRLFNRLIERVYELDLVVLREVNALIAPLMWPLRSIFMAVEEARSRGPANAGTSIRDVLAAKLGAGAASLDTVLAREYVEPLRPASPTRPIDVEKTAQLIGPSGPIAGTIEGYEERPQQVEMLRAVARAFNDGGTIVAEAGTGTGKSLAYLIPAVRFAQQNDERVVVSTNTINLQDQLYVKDLPDLRRALGKQFGVALLKGRQNYLCFQRWTAMRRRLDLTMSEILALVKVLIWLPQTETGDVGELNLTEAERAVWSRLNSNAEVCSPRRCASVGKRGCFLQYARERAAGSHVVVVNHALMLSDVAAGNGVIPEYRYLVVDEAHHLEAQATDQLGYGVRLRDVLEALDQLGHTSAERRTGVVNELSNHFKGSKVGDSARREAETIAQEISRRVEECRGSAAALFNTLGTFLKVHGTDARGYDQRTRITKGMRLNPAWRTVETAWEELAIKLTDLAGPTEQLYTLVVALENQEMLEYDALLGALAGALRFNEELREEGAAIVVEGDAERICWASVTGSEPGINSAPLNVGPLLRSSLFDQKRTTVLTSATLTTDGSFAFVRERLGLEDADELAVGSPFDYASSTLLYLPSDVPEPDRPDYGPALARSLIEVCAASGGRAMILFTSHSALRQTWQAIKRQLEGQGILVLGHGVDGTPRRHLLQTFKTNPRSVLLGTSSFWEGVDVIGENLSVLAIAKLPFAVPSDPVFAARSELFDDPFNQYALPMTILRFKQGFGRLIRSRTDRGVVICYDRRLQTKAYGGAFVRSLPPAQVRRAPLGQLPGAVAEWLKRPPG
jgi:predicted DnaQ family exonuclease/DinG family helicase